VRASANRCKQPDQVLLSCGFVLVGDGAELGGVALDGLTAGLAERFETSGGVVLTGASNSKREKSNELWKSLTGNNIFGQSRKRPFLRLADFQSKRGKKVAVNVSKLVSKLKS